MVPITAARAPASPAAQRFCALACGLASLLPFLRYHALFAKLFWFGDDVVLVDEYDRLGLWRFLGTLFAENFTPVYKLGLVAGLEAGRGSYFVLVVAAWLTHAVVVGLFARWLMRSGFSMPAAAFCALVFGLSVSHLESLGWVTQWSSLLATAFLLVACNYIADTENKGQPPSLRQAVVVALWGAASAMSFSRGILTGVCATALFLTGPSWKLLPSSARAIRIALVLAPSVIVAILVLTLPTTSRIYLVSEPRHWLKGITFGLWYLAGNPAMNLITPALLAPTTSQVALSGAVKLILIITAFAIASQPQRRVLFALLLLDLGFAGQLGMGRSYGDVHLSLSSRYQYTSLFTALPFMAVVLETVVSRLARFGPVSRLLWGITLSGGIATVMWAWPARLPEWIEWRGLHTRRVVFHPATPEEAAETVTASVPTSLLKAVTEKRGLH